MKIIHRKKALELLNEDLTQEEPQLVIVQRFINSILFIVVYLKVWHYLEMTRTFGPLVSSIKTVINDMWVFLFILLITIIAFAGALFILSKNNAENSENFWEGFKQSFEWTLGNFDTSSFNKNDL